MKFLLKGLLILLCLVVFFSAFLYLRSPLQPEVWSPAPLPTLSGIFAPGNTFNNKSGFSFDGVGPEDVIKDRTGWFYTGLSDGRIMRFRPEQTDAELVVNTGGRPLGMQFDANGNLIIADAVMGLLSWSNQNGLTILTDSVSEKKMVFVDDLDIAADGTIWFSDASVRNSYPDVLDDFIESSATGRLLSFDPASGRTTVEMDGLFFANGVALGPDDEYVLVNETGTGRIHRLWLAGDNAGQRDVFYDGLPGNPDNLSFNGSDRFWVALVTLRDPKNEFLADKPFIRKLIGGLRMSGIPKHVQVAAVAGIGLDGEVKEFYLTLPSDYHSVTSVNQFENQLVLGSLQMDSVMFLELSDVRN